MKLRKSIFTKQIETDRSVQTVWCEYAWKMSVNSKGSTLSLCCYLCIVASGGIFEDLGINIDL